MNDTDYREPLPATPVTGRAAWTGAQLRNDPSWIHDLAPLQADLEQALERVLSRGMRAFGFEREDFEAPALAALCPRLLEELDPGRGCVLLRGLDISRYAADELLALYWGLGVHLGVPVSQNSRGEHIAHVTDSGRDYQTRNVRGYTTNNAIRAHCDSADVVGLLCAQTGAAGGESVFTSSTSIFNTMLRESPELLPYLAEGFHFDLRGEGATGDPDEVTRHKVPVFSCCNGMLSTRYNCKTIEDGQRKAGEPLTGEALEAVRRVGELALREDLRFEMSFQRGDIQLLNNHNVLHARGAFEDDAEHKRDLLRLWLNMRDPRPLIPAAAERMNTGPRGGVAIRGVDY
jgi:hypothetical protein